MNNKKIIFSAIIVLHSFLSCQYFEKEKKDNTVRNAGVLLLLNKSKASTSTSTCNGSSGMVICIPSGIAE